MFGVIPFLPKGVDPSQCLPLILNGQATLAAAAASTVEVAATSLLSSYEGVILCLGVTVRTLPEYEYSGNLIFSLNLGGSPFMDNNQGTWTVQRGSILSPVPVFIRVSLNDRITFNVRREATLAGATAQVIAVFASGVMWPRGRSVPTDAARYRV